MNTEIFRVTVPGEPIAGSQLKFNRKSGHAYRPEAHRQRIFSVYEYASHHIETILFKPKPMFALDIPLDLCVRFYFGYRKGDYRTGKYAGELKPNRPVYTLARKDLDNLLKPLKDGLKGVVFADDAQIVQYTHISKRYSETPRTEITIQEATLNE